MKSACRNIVFLALVVGVKALGLELRNVVCDESLPAYIAQGDINWRCNDFSTSCSMGEEVYITGGLTYNNLALYTNDNSTGYATATLQMLTLKYELFELLPFNFCGDWVQDNYGTNNVTCPYDGRYNFNIAYTLPENKDKTSWFASGWTATSEIMIYSSRNEGAPILADCKLEFHTEVTQTRGSEYKSLPSAATVTLALLGVAMFMCLVVGFLACRKKKHRGDQHNFNDFEKYIDAENDEETVETNVETARKLANKLRYGKAPLPERSY